MTPHIAFVHKAAPGKGCHCILLTKITGINSLSIDLAINNNYRDDFQPYLQFTSIIKDPWLYLQRIITKVYHSHSIAQDIGPHATFVLAFSRVLCVIENPELFVLVC